MNGIAEIGIKSDWELAEESVKELNSNATKESIRLDTLLVLKRVIRHFPFSDPTTTEVVLKGIEYLVPDASEKDLDEGYKIQLDTLASYIIEKKITVIRAKQKFSTYEKSGVIGHA